jgi:hypothetical protein
MRRARLLGFGGRLASAVRRRSDRRRRRATGDAKGKGPVAPVLSPRPTDLTKLAQRYGTSLPKPAISEFIDGRREIRAHGSSDMPVFQQPKKTKWTLRRTGGRARTGPARTDSRVVADTCFSM